MRLPFRCTWTHVLVRRHVAALLAVGLFWVPPAEAQQLAGDHRIEQIGRADAGGAAAVYDPKSLRGEEPTIEEPAALNRERWDALVFNTEHTGGRPFLKETGVIARDVVPTIRICLQSPDVSLTGERLVPYSDAAWWSRQIERWTGLHWSGEIRIAACTEPSNGWINVREGQPDEFSVIFTAAHVETRRGAPENQNEQGRWLRSEIVYNPDEIFVGTLDQYFEEILAHELGHAMGFAHVFGAGYVMGSISSTTWPQEESDLAQLAYRVGPHVRYPGLVRRDLSHPGDRSVLDTFFDATGGPNWTESARWGSPDAPLSWWYGVGTDETGRVLDVRLPRNNLSGSLPSELGNLSRLGRLDLDYDNLTGPLPPELGDLSEMRVLWLQGNNFSGAIPPTLGRLSNLFRLVLGNNNLTGAIPPELGDLSSLTHLSLSGNNLTGPLPPELGDLSALHTLGLSGNNLTGAIPPELGDLSSLEYLFLNRNNFTGPLPASLTNLRRLNALFIDVNAGLCAPADEAFQAWLATVGDFRGPVCVGEPVPALPLLGQLLLALGLTAAGARLMRQRRRV